MTLQRKKKGQDEKQMAHGEEREIKRKKEQGF